MAKRTRENITGYVGPMFCRKTLMLLHQIGAAEAVGEKVVVIKPAVDDRFAQNEIRSRNGGSHEAIPVDSSRAILKLITKEHPDLVAIDEAQFFDEELPEVVLCLAEEVGIPVAFAALNKDFRGEPFGPVPRLMAISTELVMIPSRCTFNMGNGKGRKCGADAKHTQRLINGQPAPYDSPIVVIEKLGKKSVVSYEARCPDHWFVPGMPTRVNLKD